MHKMWSNSKKHEQFKFTTDCHLVQDNPSMVSMIMPLLTVFWPLPASWRQIITKANNCLLGQKRSSLISPHHNDSQCARRTDGLIGSLQTAIRQCLKHWNSNIWMCLWEQFTRLVRIHKSEIKWNPLIKDHLMKDHPVERTSWSKTNLMSAHPDERPPC